MDLTNEQYLKIEEMNKKTNAPLTICKSYLESSGYNLGIAISSFNINN